MGNNRKLQFAIRAVLAVASAASVAQVAYAQAAPSSAPAEEALEEVIVTGSRLVASPNAVSISPITSVSAEDIAKVGVVRTEDLLNTLPQVVAENSSGQAISSDGTATVSLRGLTSERTLALVNGRRMAPGASINSSSSPDINQIPSALIERVDVLTGGASAVYGADAVAGVVNFVLNTKFEGVRIDGNYGFAIHKNDDETLLGLLAAKNNPLPESTVHAGFNKDISVLIGSNFADGKGNATAYFTYLRSAPVVGSQYDYAGCTLNTPSSLPDPNGKLSCGGSSSSATGRYLLLGLNGAGATTTLADKTVAPTGGFRDYSSARDAYNYGALSYLQRQAERYTAGTFINYDINEHTNVYNEFMFARNTSTAEYGASGLFAFGTPSISCSNPLFSPSQLADLCSPANIAANQALFGGTGDRITLYAARRSVESGPRIDNYTSNSFREVLGVKGDWGDAWTYDFFGQLAITQMSLFEQGFLGTQQINNALDVVPDTRPGTLGQPVCQSVLNGSDPACVPWNIWAPGGVTPQQLAYLGVQSSYGIKATEYVVNGSVTGDLGKYGVKLPSAENGMMVNLGAEYRQEKYDFDPDYIFGNGFASGGNGAFSQIHGQFHVAEVFTEVRLPLIDDKPGAYSLSTEAGYRFSDYTSGFTTNTYKFGLEWAPIKDVKFRGGYNRAIRAPNVTDLFAPIVIGAGGTADPCWGPKDANGLVGGNTFEFCQRTGVTAGQFGNILANPAAQINTATGGNVNLTPEIADTYSFGVVLQPDAVPGLLASFDFYNIKIKNTINQLTSNTVINNCGLSGDATLCGLIHRGPTGSLWFNNNNFVDVTKVNIGTIQVKGIDVSVHYGFDMGKAGKMSLNLTGTKAKNFLTQPLPTGAAYDCTGYEGTTCDAPNPKWKHVFGADWSTPWGGLDLSLRWRYIGKVASDRTSSDPQLNDVYFPQTSFISAYNYIDLSASMPVTSGVNVRVGVNNIADKNPPIIPNGTYSDCPNTSCNDNTWVGTYDTLGRYVYAHVSVKF